MTIASRVYTPEVAAAAFRMQALAEALEPLSDVVVLTTRPPAGAPSTVAASSIGVRRAPVLRDRTGAIRGYVQYLSFDVPLFIRLLFGRADVIVAEAPPTTGFVCLVVARLRRRRLVYYPGDIWSDAMASMGAAKWAVSVMRWLESHVVMGADRTLAVSPEVRQRVEALGAQPGDVALVGNGIDTAVFHPDVESPEGVERPYFVYTGTMSEWQGPDVFVRALAELVDVDVRFFGQGTVESDLRELAERVAPGRVYFGGVVSPAESARWIRGAVGALVSIVPGIGYDFARPTKTYAAAACGTPVLFAGASTGGDLVRKNDLGIAVSFTSAEVAEAMARLIAEAESGETEQKRPARAGWAVREVSLQGVAARAAAIVRGAIGQDPPRDPQ